MATPLCEGGFPLGDGAEGEAAAIAAAAKRAGRALGILESSALVALASAYFDATGDNRRQWLNDDGLVVVPEPVFRFGGDSTVVGVAVVYSNPVNGQPLWWEILPPE